MRAGTVRDSGIGMYFCSLNAAQGNDSTCSCERAVMWRGRTDKWEEHTDKLETNRPQPRNIDARTTKDPGPQELFITHIYIHTYIPVLQFRSTCAAVAACPLIAVAFCSSVPGLARPFTTRSPSPTSDKSMPQMNQRKSTAQPSNAQQLAQIFQDRIRDGDPQAR